MEQCSKGSSQQAWILKGGRLWQADKKTKSALREDFQGDRDLVLQPCDASLSSQHWKLSSNPGHSVQSTVQNKIPFWEGGCWAINGCETKDGAGVAYGWCKPLPRSGWTQLCDASAAWSFNPNGTITSVMDGKCLQIGSDDPPNVNVAACNGNSGQQWKVNGLNIESLGRSGHCIDSGIPMPPSSSTGQCAAVKATNLTVEDRTKDILGPALQLNAGQDCTKQIKPWPAQEFSIDERGRFHAGELCVAGRHGAPSSFGPMQMWTKPLPGGALALVLLNRAKTDSRAVDVSVELKDLPGFESHTSTPVRVRDVWTRKDLGKLKGEALQLVVPGGDSRFILLTPEST